ncbi:MAG: glycosyltransferase family 4 protein [Chitinophagaceae bacterium]|nr:glycosyltransferase family 4 protein [Chitinophagaceae bacterium]
MVINTLKKGGKERRMLELIKGLTKDKSAFQVYLVSLTDTVDYPYVYELPITFETITKKNSKDFSLAFKLRKIIRTFRPDIIHSWDVTASAYLNFANAFINKPILHGIIYDASAKLNSFNKSLYYRIKLLSPFAKVFIANSMAGLKAYETPPRKSVCIYNGIDMNRFNDLKSVTDVEQEILGERKGDKFIIAMVAAFEIRKDQETLIKAAIKMCAADQTLVFLLIGNGIYMDAIKAKVPADMLDKQIKFLGNRHDIESILQIVDTGVLITNSENHGEGISNSIVEYMASAKPVIATRGGGTDEIVMDGVNGFLIDPKNEEQIIEKISVLKRDAGYSRALGKNAYQLISEKFTAERMTASYIDLYNKYLN